MHSKALINLTKLALYLCLFIHIQGCLWFSVCSRNVGRIDKSSGFDYTWVPPLDYVNYRDSSLFDEETPLMKKYVDSFYYSVLMLNTNEMGPVNSEEIAFCLFSMITSSFVYQVVFSEIAEIIRVFSLRDASY
mmetsp:Transcript_34639/g.52988  ORF Transcript_34639/g.52988 Transcript_34639/m.52988 type:complete len:133 (-) Transcript_34639:2784-3182(-)